MLELHPGRNCTGCRLTETNYGMAIDPADPPRPTRGKRPAYPDGLRTVAADPASDKAGSILADLLIDEAPVMPAIESCVRFVWADPAAQAWLRLFAGITTGLRAAPADAPGFYDRIMLGIHGVRARASARREG
jgi:hypothetical protein